LCVKESLGTGDNLCPCSPEEVVRLTTSCPHQLYGTASEVTRQVFFWS
jgi:hypothetical protein